MSYYDKYLKYKNKYFNTKLIGGTNPTSFRDLIQNINTYVPDSLSVVDKERLINEKINYLLGNGGNINDTIEIINPDYPDFPSNKTIIDLAFESYNNTLIKCILLNPNTVINSSIIINLLSDGCDDMDKILLGKLLILNKPLSYDEGEVEGLSSLLRLLKTTCNDELLANDVKIDSLINKIERNRKEEIKNIPLRKILVPSSYKNELLKRKPYFNTSLYVFDETDVTKLQKLSATLRKDRVTLLASDPITVKKIIYNRDEYYEVTDGRHRFFYYLLNNFKNIRALVK